MLPEQADGCLSCTSKRPPCRAYGNCNASPRLPDKYHDTGRSVHKQAYRRDYRVKCYLDNHCCLEFVGIQAKRRDFHCSCECSVCDPRGEKKLPLVS